MKYWFPVLLAGWMSVANAGLFGDDELLPPDEAFIFTASVNADGSVRADWKITDGYYLYRDKFHFSTGDSGTSLGAADYPPGKIKTDEIFGRVETYRKKVSIGVPVIRQSGAGNQLSFTATYQGCADIGVCYPPQTKTVSLQLPNAPTPASSPVATNSALGALNALGANFGFDDENALLPPDEAFRLDVLVRDADHIAASWVIAEGYYLYRDKFEFALEPVKGVTLQPVQMPEGEHKNDEFFGDIQVFHEIVDVELGLRREAGPATPVTLVVKYQGCAEAGVCYQPMSKRIELMLPPADGSSAAAIIAPEETAPAPSLSEQDAIARRLANGNLIATLLAFYGFGLLLSFTPCVFPMIPILSSIIVGQGSSITLRKSFTLSLVYVLAMAATYTLAGVVAGLFGENLQAIFQNAWLLSGFAAVFVLLSLSMFGFYELQMPPFIQNRLSGVSNRQKSGSLTGVAVMGFLSALIVGPCVAAPLAGALIYIGQTGDAVLGGLALFTLSMGMGTPLIAIGVGAGKLLPKAGVWMDRVKAVFGVLMLGVAIWLLERILPPSTTLLLWSALLLMSSVYLGALDNLPVEATGWSRLWKGLGLLSLVYGVILLIGAASGGSDPLRPLAGISTGGGGGSGNTAISVQAHALSFKPIHSLTDLERELDAAARDGKPVMIDFYADWCISCKEMEKHTFGNARVQQALEGFVLLQADVTENNKDDKALLKRFGLFGPPGILFFDASGQERKELSVVGFKKADAFLQTVERVKK